MQKKSNGPTIDNLLSLATIMLIVIGIAASLIYWYMLDRNLSSNPNDWGAFGSYIGGVLGPAVSFVALIAVLKTISLQRAAAAVQQTQFTQMQEMQKEVIDAQNKQLELATQTAIDERVLAYKAAVMKVVEQQIAYYTNGVDIIDRKLHLFATLEDAATMAELKEKLLHLDDQRGIAERRVKGLQDFVMTFMLKQHRSTDEIQIEVRNELAAAYK